LIEDLKRHTPNIRTRREEEEREEDCFPYHYWDQHLLYLGWREEEERVCSCRVCRQLVDAYREVPGVVQQRPHSRIACAQNWIAFRCAREWCFGRKLQFFVIFIEVGVSSGEF